MGASLAQVRSSLTASRPFGYANQGGFNNPFFVGNQVRVGENLASSLLRSNWCHFSEVLRVFRFENDDTQDKMSMRDITIILSCESCFLFSWILDPKQFTYNVCEYKHIIDVSQKKLLVLPLYKYTTLKKLLPFVNSCETKYLACSFFEWLALTRSHRTEKGWVLKVLRHDTMA